ncbi:MAG TPA: FAD-dependent oxidoreductase [Pirellulales bacterium]|nr:FAD-dependent oxidoreductase [Pirellulales bacterium]
MADPFLLAHRVLPRFYLLSYPLAPLSIRDQIIRGRWMLDRLLDTGTIKSNDSDGRMLVVGAGVAGTSAALRAVERQVYVKLVEKASAPFLVQASAATRWIDPTQYDWPADHWLSATYNWTVPDMPLRFRADWANLLAARWTIELRAKARPGTYLEYVENSECVDVRPDASNTGRLVATFDPDSGAEPFSAVIWAGGFGDELSRLRNAAGQTIYRGMPFWRTDQFTTPTCGVAPASLGGPAPQVRVVIAGGGDGALQDFLRITTRTKSAVEFYRKIRVPSDVERQVYSPADRCERNWIWGEGNLHDHRPHFLLDSTYQDVVEALLSDPSFRARLDSAIPRDVPPIRVFYPCDHLTAFYGLNRFLARLVATFLNLYREQHHKEKILNRGWRLVDVKPDDPNSTHSCRAMGPTGCLGVWHRAIFQEAPRCYDKTLGTATHDERANVLIIRFGIDTHLAPRLPFPQNKTTQAEVAKLVGEMQLRHHLPYHILAPDQGGSWA